MHTILAVVKCHMTYFGRLLWDKTSVFYIIEVCIIAWVFDFTTIFYNPELRSPKHDDSNFLAWLFLEILIVFGIILGAILYVLIYNFVKRPTLQMIAPSIQVPGKHSFFCLHMCLNDLFNTCVVSAGLCGFVNW